MIAAENGGDDDVLLPMTKTDDDVVERDDDDVDSAESTVVDQKEEFEEPFSIQVGDIGISEKDDLSDNSSVENSPSDERLTEDGAKEEMFVDCPDAIEESEQSFEDTDDTKEALVHELVNGTHNDGLMHTPTENKNDDQSLLKEISNFHHHLKALSHEQPLSTGTGESLEIEKSLSIHDTAIECSKLVKNALDEKLRMDEELKKLQSSIMEKDQEIENLHAKVSELSVSRNVVFSFFDLQNHSLSDSSNPSAEVQYGLQSIDDSINRSLASLATSVNVEGLSDNSLTGRMLFVEQNVSQIIGNYQYLISEIELLRQSLTEVSSDFNIQEDFWTTTAVARNLLLELKRKEVDFGQNLSNLEEENKKVSADTDKLRVELEQEKNKSANTKEKLSLAVTKGKALVQQRDSLKQLMAEKTSLIEKYLAEIEEKSRALEGVDLVKEELVKNENLVASMQETISQKDYILSKCEEILYQTSSDHELESSDIIERIRCLVDEKNNMAGVVLEFEKLEDIVSSVDFPENISYPDLRSRISWLVESFLLANDEMCKLKNEIARSGEAANDDIERLTVTLLAETREKKTIQEELEGLTHKYEEIVAKVSHLLMEKDHIDEHSDLFEKMQNELYITNQKLFLCEELLEEDTQKQEKINTLVVELGTISQELQVLKDEKSALERELERSDEKTSSLREKLSLAVKKGKGLVQDRENLKKHMDEKTAEIEKLNLELEQQNSVVDDLKNHISKILTELELIPKLETDLNTMKDQKHQTEQCLMKSNNMIQTVMESIDGVDHPNDVSFEQSIDKVLWIVRYLNECQDAKILLEQELGSVKADFDSISSKLLEAYAAKSLLEEALSTAENKISQLGEEKKELGETCGTIKSLEDSLLEAENSILFLKNERDDAQLCNEKLKEEISTQTTRLAEAYRTINSLEDALSQLETNVSLLSKENNDAQAGKSNLENEMKMLKEEAESQSSRFVFATSTIRSLENTLDKLFDEKKNAEEEILTLKEEAESQANRFLDITSTVKALEGNLSQLADEKKNAKEEILILKKEAESQDTKLFDAASTIRSLEDRLSKLVAEKKNAEVEMSLLNSRLNVCKDELAGLGVSAENRSLELSSYLDNLQMLLKDETLLSLLRQSFEVKFQSLTDMDLLLRDINSHLPQMGSDSLPTSSGIEENPLVDKLSAGFDNVEIYKADDNSEDSNSFESCFERTLEGIHSRNRILSEKIQGSSTSMDNFLSVLLNKLKTTRDEVVHKLDQVRSLDQQVKGLETEREATKQKIASLDQKVKGLETEGEARELKMASLENDVRVLFSACTVTVQEFEIEAKNYRGELSSAPELEKWTNIVADVRGNKPAVDLLMAAQKMCALIRFLESERSVSADAIQVLENKMRERKATVESIIEERDVLHARVSKLQTDLEELQSSHQEMSSKVEDYHAKDTTVHDLEAEISSLHTSLTMKEKEVEEGLLVASQIKSLYNKINDLEIPFAELNIGETEFDDSNYMEKIFYVVDAVTIMQRQLKTLIQDKEKLQLTVEKQTHQIENLEEEVDDKGRENVEFEKIKNEMVEVELIIENIVRKLGGNDLAKNHKLSGLKGLLALSEKLVTDIILDFDNTKSKFQEVVVKLHGSEKLIDDLSEKVKLLEASRKGRSSSSDGVEERSILEAPPLPARSEIIELDDVGKKAVGQAPSAAHARTLRKGSNDHLAIDIDSESDRLIKNEESDEDKGKVFKSLNTSGLVPRQGKLFADRVDGYWVSGDRALMSRPRARLGLIAYWLLLHIWLLGTIL